MTPHKRNAVSATKNRFFEVLDHEFNRAARYKNDVALIFIKISRLDEIGKLYGRLTARRQLRKIERLIRSNIRSSDWQFNYETDELMLILPNTPISGANCMIPKLTQLIESRPFIRREGDPIELSAEFSIASYAHDVQDRLHEIRLAGNNG